MKRFVFYCVAALQLALPLFAEDFHPTPYAAEEIRDAWKVGFQVTTRLRTAEGDSYSRTEVLEWSQEGFRMSDRAVSADGETTDDDVRFYSGTWTELRDHAKFPESTTTRERVKRETALGSLEGWLYRVHGEQGESELFFADGLPGPPVVFRKMTNGEVDFVAEQVDRSP